MSSKWTWIFGFATAAAFVLGIIFFIATQSITARDWIVLAIGLVLGALITAFIATFIWHGDARKTKNQQAAATTAASIESQKKAEDARAASEEAVVAKRVELMGLIPSREAQLQTLRSRKLELEVQIHEAYGHKQSYQQTANEARLYGYGSSFEDAMSEVRQWDVIHKARTEDLALTVGHIERIGSLSDEEWKAEQIAQRLVDYDDVTV